MVGRQSGMHFAWPECLRRRRPFGHASVSDHNRLRHSRDGLLGDHQRARCPVNLQTHDHGCRSSVTESVGAPKWRHYLKSLSRSPQSMKMCLDLCPAPLFSEFYRSNGRKSNASSGCSPQQKTDIRYFLPCAGPAGPIINLAADERFSARKSGWSPNYNHSAVGDMRIVLQPAVLPAVMSDAA
jgi:hypothetical protein